MKRTKGCDNIVTKEKTRFEKVKLKVNEFCLFDDDFMNMVFEDDYESTALILSIILQKDLKIISVRTQYNIKNLEGHSVILDIHAIDSDGKEYDIEIQRQDKGACVKRARYNSSIMDTKMLPASEDYADLQESYVIFITKKDVLGGNKAIYHIERVIDETGEYFGDGAHIIYVNGSYKSDSPLGLLMHDFSCSNPEDMHYKILADRARYFKQNEEGVKKVSKIMEEMAREFATEVAEEMAEEKLKAVVAKMLRSGKLSVEEIAEYSELPVDTVKEIQNTWCDLV